MMQEVRDVGGLQVVPAEGWVVRAREPAAGSGRRRRGLKPRPSRPLVCWVLHEEGTAQRRSEGMWVLDRSADSALADGKSWRYLPTGQKLADLRQQADGSLRGRLIGGLG